MYKDIYLVDLQYRKTHHYSDKLCKNSFGGIKGPTGIDRRMNGYVSMPGVVNLTRKSHSQAINADYDYALAA